MSVRDLLSAAGSSSEKLYVDDVFSTYLYSGNGSTQTINNGIDLAGKGGLVWIKSRTTASNHRLVDTLRGAGSYLSSDTFAAQALETTGVSSFSASGFNLGSNVGYNGSGPNYVSWTFRKAPKFFDVVTYVGNGAAYRVIPHSLGGAPGMVVVKAISTTGDWKVYHRSFTEAGYMLLNSAAAFVATGTPRPLYADVSNFYVYQYTSPWLENQSGVTYVAYLFAHDPSADGIIQCGSYIGNGSSVGPVVNLGWEPQFLLIKNSTGTGDWQVIDHMRGMPVGSADAALQLNLASGESIIDYVSPTATGFQVTSNSSEVNTTGQTYIYMAIRRPNKPPTSGTEVFASAVMTGNGVEGRHVPCGFAADAFMSSRITSAASHGFANRLAGVGGLWTDSSDAEYGYGGSAQFQLSGWDVSSGVRLKAGYGAGFDTNSSNLPYSQYFFRRAPGFFDVVCYTGNGQASQYVSHSLKVKPEIIIAKSRSTDNWLVSLGTTLENSIGLYLNTSSAKLGSSIGIATRFSDENTFYTGTATDSANTLSTRYVAYLFASLPGISKVGTYTGNGASQNIACEFTTGARFILIKRVDSTGDWYVWDSARGIVAANDPHLSLNTTAAEVTTDDSVDPDASGFIVNQNTATNINVSGGTYIFLAIS